MSSPALIYGKENNDDGQRGVADKCISHLMILYVLFWSSLGVIRVFRKVNASHELCCYAKGMESAFKCKDFFCL